MKMNLFHSLAASAVFVLSAPAFALPLTGTYQVVQSDCDATGILITGQQALVQATRSGIRAGVIMGLADSSGQIGAATEFEAAFEFAVGSQRIHALGDGYQVYQGSYSPDGRQFKDVLLNASADSAEPVYAGEVDFNLNGKELEIDVTADGQPQPAPLKVCRLKKLD